MRLCLYGMTLQQDSRRPTRHWDLARSSPVPLCLLPESEIKKGLVSKQHDPAASLPPITSLMVQRECSGGK